MSTTEFDNILEPKKPCQKIIGITKYERADKSTQKWWEQQFKIVEDHSKMPFYKRRNHLEQCFPKETMKKLISTGIEINPDWGDDIEPVKRKGVVTPPASYKLAPVVKVSSFEKTSEPEEYTNPYLNFFKKTKRNAQVWRPKRKLTIEEVPLIKKAEIFEDTTASEFDEWFNNVGSKKKSEIDKDVILSIFEIVMSYPIMTSINRHLIEIGSVPEVTAKHLGFPEKSEGNSVQREIKMDIHAGLQKPMVVAFNKTLPMELQRKPFTENLKEKWFEYQIHHQDLESMAAVWQGVTELQTTRVFIEWLGNHPEIVPPVYLKNEGFMDKKLVMKSLLDLNINIEDFDWAAHQPSALGKLGL